MAVPSISTYSISNGSHRYGSIGGAAVMTSPSDSVTKVSAIISQTSGGAAIETVETTVKTSSDQFADRWALSWPTTGITSSPYYVKMWATNADGNGPTREAAPYIYFPPTVAITAPANGSTLASASVTVAWTASDPYGISAQRVTVLHGADVLLDEAVGESDTSYAVPSSVAFLDGESYTFRVTARNGNGMEASADSTVAFSFDAPAAASVTITDDGATATIAVDDPHYSESGATISVDGSAIADSFTVFGNSTQDGTPTPGAPVPIESVVYENIFDISKFPKATTTYAGCTITNNGDGSFTLSGTNSQSIAWGFNSTTGTQTLPAGTYTLSCGGAIYGCYFRASIGGTSYQIIGNGSYTFTIDSPKNITQWIITVYASASVSGTFRPTLVRGTRAPKFDVPYGESIIAVEDVVANVGTIVTGGAVTESGGVYTGTAGNLYYNNSQYGCIAESPSFFPQSLSISLDAYTDGNDGTTGNGIMFIALDNSGAIAKNLVTLPNSTTSWTTFTGNLEGITNAKKIVLSYSSLGANIWHIRNLCVRLDGSTEYVPYEYTAYPIDLQGNALRSLPDGTHDELRVEGGNAVLVKRCEETLQAVTDGVTGTVGVDVLSATGEIANGVQVVYKLAAPQEIDLGAVSDMPFIPEDGEMWVDGTEMEASLRPADYAGQPPISSVDIARVNPDGTWTLAQGVTEGQSAIDPLPPLGVPYRYALTSHAAGGGTKVAYVEHIVETRAWHLNFGNAAQEHVSYLYNPQATMTLAQGGESYHFADGGAGRGLPVFYPTTDRDMSGTLRFDTVLYGDSDILLDLCDRYPVAWLRDPFGHRWRAHVRPSVSHGTGQVWPVTIAWDAVRFEEV